MVPRTAPAGSSASVAALCSPDPVLRAEPHFAVAEDLFHDLGLVFDLAVTKLEHAEWLVAQGRGGDAADLLGEARETFEHLQAAPWLERVAGAEARLPAAVTA